MRKINKRNVTGSKRVGFTSRHVLLLVRETDLMLGKEKKKKKFIPFFIAIYYELRASHVSTDNLRP